MGVKVIQITCLLLLFIGGSVAPSPPSPPTGPQVTAPKPWMKKRIPTSSTPLSPVITSNNQQDIQKALGQSNGGLQAPSSPPVGTNTGNNQADQATQAGNSRIAQLTARARQGKDAVINTINPKKTKEELETELRNMIAQLEKSFQAATLLRSNAPMKTQEELDTELNLIKNELKPTIMGPSQIMTQVNKAKNGIQGVINNPASVKDLKPVQAVVNHPTVQTVVKHPRMQAFLNHRYTQKVQELARPWIDKIWNRDTPQTVM